jgi:hypothetical protein
VITRRDVLLTGFIGLIGHSYSRGQLTDAFRHIAWFSIGSRTSPHNGYVAFTQGMLDLGCREAKNIEYRRVYADFDVSHLNV